MSDRRLPGTPANHPGEPKPGGRFLERNATGDEAKLEEVLRRTEIPGRSALTAVEVSRPAPWIGPADLAENGRP